MVRVVVRRNATVHGVVTGFLRAFDKHFNLLLTDVDEEYTPRRSHIRPQGGSVVPGKLHPAPVGAVGTGGTVEAGELRGGGPPLPADVMKR